MDVVWPGLMFGERTRSISISNTVLENHKLKRSRTGSISGRLRTASDLEEWGWVDKNAKGILKDLIISEDPTLQSALDKFGMVTFLFPPTYPEIIFH